MTLVPWIPVVERLPVERTVVIVCQDDPSLLCPKPDAYPNGYRTFAGWWEDGKWWSCDPDHGLTMMGHGRATDFWLTLPVEHPQHGAVRGGYPA